MNKQSLEPSPKTKELRPIGVSSELLQGYLGHRVQLPFYAMTCFC